MPAEWAEHRGTWIAWPKSLENWPDGALDRVEGAYLTLIEALHRREQVNVLVDGPREAEAVLDRMRRSGISSTGVFLHEIPTRDVWIRDYGPTFLLRRAETGFELGAVRWEYNAWGGKYADLLADAGVPDGIFAKMPKTRVFRPEIVLEGGSIDVNGEGLCLTTRQCLLNPNRNPGLGAAQIETHLKKHLGLTAVLWLEGGIEGDDTDGHVDDVARFVAPRRILMARQPDSSDPDSAVLEANIRALREQTERLRLNIDLVEMPMPRPVQGPAGRVPASYMNFYIGNGVVLLPVFNDPADERAVQTVRDLFPRHTVVPVECREFVWGLGAVHCATQQQPETERRRA